MVWFRSIGLVRCLVACLYGFCRDLFLLILDFLPGYGNEVDAQQLRLSRSRGWNWTYATARGVSWQHSVTRVCKGYLWIFFFLGLLRVGEARHPGPDGTWTFGVANPSGLNNKLDQVLHMEGDVWLMSETQLSKQGLSGFCKGLKMAGSPWKAIPGAPCPTRGPTETGTHAGVMMLSKFPARPLPHGFGDSFASARLQVCGFVVGQAWVSAGVLYGYPENAVHKQARFQTDCLLAELVDRVCCQGHGLRAIGGDFNFDVGELSQLQRLHDILSLASLDPQVEPFHQPQSCPNKHETKLSAHPGHVTTKYSSKVVATFLSLPSHFEVALRIATGSQRFLA